MNIEAAPISPSSEVEQRLERENRSLTEALQLLKEKEQYIQELKDELFKISSIVNSDIPQTKEVPKGRMLGSQMQGMQGLSNAYGSRQ